MEFHVKLQDLIDDIQDILENEPLMDIKVTFDGKGDVSITLPWESGGNNIMTVAQALGEGVY